MPTAPPTRRLFVTLSSDLIYTAEGRRIFYVLNPFVIAGYQVQLLRHPEFDKFGREGKMLLALDGLTVVDEVPSVTEDMTYLFDVERPDCRRRQWRKKIVLRFDVFSSYAGATDQGRPPIIVPWPIHPTQAGPDLQERLERARGNQKQIGVFFSGDVKGYTNRHIFFPRPKLTRTEVLDTLCEQLPGQTRFLGDDDEIDQAFSQPNLDQCVIIDTSKTWIDDWLNRLSKADFFLSAPGIVMPICHNAVEAMAVGAIPIINYPEWFQPPLEHMRNCIVFDYQQDLKKKVTDALNMDRGRIDQLREGAIRYYQQHLEPLLFAKAVESRPEDTVTLLLLTEQYVRDNSSKLSRHSILVRDPRRPVASRWLRALGRLGINR